MPSLTESRLAQVLLGTAITTVYTVPTATSAVVKEITVSNFASVTQTVEIWAGPGSEITQRVVPSITIPACGILSWWGTYTLTPSDVVRGKASAASALHCAVYGGEIK